MKSTPSLLKFAPIVATLALATSIHAADGTWTNITTAGNWTDSTKWSVGTIANGATSTANFTSNITAATSVSLNGVNRTIGNLVFSDNGAAGSTWTITGNILTLGDNGAIALIPTITTTTNATISSILAGNDGLTKTGAGTLTLNGVNTYTGTTTVSGGTLIVDNNGGGTTSTSSSTFTVNGASTLSFTATNGAGGRNDMTGKTWNFDSVGGGTITGSAGNWLMTGTVNTNGGARNTINGNPINMNSGSFIFNVSRGTDATSDLTVTSALNNTGGGVTKNGTGILTLSGASGYTGATTINGGTLNLTSTGSLTSAVTVNSGGTFALNGTSNKDVIVTSGGILTGTGSTTAGTITLNNGSGILLNSAGSVQGANFSIASGTNVFITEAPTGSSVTRDVIRYIGATPGVSNLTAAANYRGGSYTDASNKISLTYTAEAKTWAATGGGTWDINTSTPWTGGDSKFAWGDSVAFGDTAADQAVTLTGDLAPSAITVSNSANTYTFGGTGRIIGASSLTKSGGGKLILNNTNTNTGGTTISGGTLQIGTGGTTGTLGAGAITLASGTTLDFRRSDSIDLTSGHLFSPSSAGNVTMNAGAGTIGIRTNVVADTVSMTSTNGGVAQSLYGSSYATAISLFGAGGVSHITTTGNQTYAGQVSIGSNVANQVTTLKTTGGGSITLSSGVSSGRSGYWSAGTLNIDTSTGNGAVSLSGTTTGTYGVANLNVSTGTGVTTLTGGSYYYDFSVFNGDVALTANSNFQNSNQWVRGVTFKGNVTGTGKTLTATLGNGAASTEGAGTTGLILDTNSTQTVSVNLAGSAGPTKTGSGTTTLSGTNTYTGATLVSAGTLLVNGSLGNTAVTVDTNGTLGGTGTIAGSLAFNGTSFLTIADINDALAVTGAVTFGTGFGIDNITGWDYANAADGIYTLIAGNNVNLANLDNVGLANAYNLGNGRSAYFKQGSLQMVLVPEPTTALLGGLSLLALLRRRRG